MALNKAAALMAPWAGGFVLLAAPAMAQSGSGQASPAAPPVAESDAASIGEIVVTAQKRAQAINYVGMSINAISGDALASQRLISTADLARVVPGRSETRRE